MAIAARKAIVSVVSLFVGVAILMVGNGLQGTLIAVRGVLEDFSTHELGVIQSAYFAGFTLGSLYCSRMIERAGHIRTFAALTSVASAVALAHLLVIDAMAWIAFRAVTGFCFAGLYMVIESWLNAAAENEIRGRVFSTYMIVNLSALMVGQLGLAVADPAGFVLFAMASIIVSLALVPVVMTRTAAPEISASKPASLGRLFKVSPLGVFGCVAYGSAMSAFWGLGPVYAQQIGLDAQRIGYFMSATILGGLLLQWPVGWLSDRLDRRTVIVAAAMLTALAAVALPLFAGGWAGTLFLAIAFGAAAFPIYSLTIAHVNDFIERHEMVAVSSALLLVHGIGAVIGPLASGLLMAWIGPGGLYFYIAAIFAAIGAFSLYRMTRRGPAPEQTQEIFAPAAAATAQALPLDPRSSD